MKHINIFWTGGLDSTCRVLELSTIPNVEIQPYYIKFPTRKSADTEIKSVQEMTKIIRELLNYNGGLLDLKVFNKNDFRRYGDIHLARSNQKRIGKYSVGYQYCYCADLCRYFNIRCEVSLEDETTCCAHRALKHEVTLTENELDYFIDLTKTKNNNICKIFKDIDFPKTIWHMSKSDEIEYIKSVCPELLNHFHFCHRKEDGFCCECSPCKSYIKLGLLNPDARQLNI